MISQETIQGLVEALDTLSDATNEIVYGEIPQEASIINTLNSTSTTDALSANMGRELKEMIENGSPVADAYTKVETDTLLDTKSDKTATYTKTEVDSLIQGGGTPVDAYTTSETDALLLAKADKSTTYTKTEVDSLVQGGGTPVDAYTTSETDALLLTKADKTTTYTKTETDISLSAKADKSTTYTKTEADTQLSAKADASTTYTKTEVDTALSGKASTTDVTNKANLKLATSGNTAMGEIMFGKDDNGKYGYIPEGADTVIPFKSGSGTLKTVNIGTFADSNKTFNITDIEGWQDFTVDNFAVGISSFSGREQGSQVKSESISIAYNYNSSTGILSITLTISRNCYSSNINGFVKLYYV